ncbi:MAG TPA: S8 family serine peptidase [Nitrospira sp.]|nr:S8 family serine peptidase [Nitrospira sp.]
MATKRTGTSAPSKAKMESTAASTTEQLLLAALERGGESLETGRYLITYREEATDQGLKSLKAQGFRVADARDFDEQAVTPENVGDADALLFPEIGVAVVGGAAMQERGMSLQSELETDGPIQIIEPEYFVFSDSSEYLRGFASAANTIAKDLGMERGAVAEEEDMEAAVLGATWGLVRCKVPPSVRSGLRIKVAVLDTGMDLGHPDFAGRLVTSQTFVGQPVQDLHGHGTHCIGTACGPLAPPSTTPRYGIAHRARIFAGKVLTNSGSGTGAGVLAGMNWAIANRCEVISMSLGSQSPVQAAYTNAGAAALRNGCLIIAAAGNAGPTGTTGAPANSPTIMSVASLDPTLAPSSFSNRGKIEIAAPGRDVFSSWPRPTRYRTISGTSMATPHVAGCAALWAQSSSTLRGTALWRQLQSSARRLPFPASSVGSGLVQAP